MTHPTRPNIVFIVADDLGYADLGCYGGREAAFGPVSPVLDQLAANGLKLTQGYSNSPVCSPTRFAPSRPSQIGARAIAKTHSVLPFAVLFSRHHHEPSTPQHHLHRC